MSSLEFQNFVFKKTRNPLYNIENKLDNKTNDDLFSKKLDKRN